MKPHNAHVEQRTRVGFSTPNWFNPLSWAIRKITKSRTSHAWFLYWDDDFEMEMVMEAHELGFRLVPYEAFKRHNEVVAVFIPRRSLEAGLVTVATRFLSSRYDFGGLLGMAVVKLGRWFKRTWKNPLRSDKHVFCSEALAIAMRCSQGYDDFVADPSTVDPEAMMRYFATDGSIRADV